MNIEILGHVCVDHNDSENTSYIGAGSPAMFMNKIFTQLPDCDPGIIASYGKDYLKYLDGIKIFPSNPNLDKSLIYKNISKDGKRSQKAINREADLPIDVVGLDEIVGMADVLLFAPILPNFKPPYYSIVSGMAKEDSLKVLLPQGYFRNFDQEDNVVYRDFLESDQVLSYVDIVIVSEQDHPDMVSIASNWSIDNDLVSVVTLGEKGAVALYSGREIFLPSSLVSEKDTVDSVGSGDIFSAGFAYRYRQTKDIYEAGRFANEIARQALFYPSGKIKIDLANLFI